MSDTIDWAKALQYARPGAIWDMGPTLESLRWQGPGEPPTQQELEAAWIEYSQAEAAQQSAITAMAAARSAMAAILDALPMGDRMKLQPLRVSVEHALNLGQVDLALYIVTEATVDEHLLPVRAQILALFPQP